jgi:hypothetical protein
MNLFAILRVFATLRQITVVLVLKAIAGIFANLFVE